MVVASKEIVADCPFAGPKVYALEAVRSLNSDPSELPWSFSVWVRCSQPSGSRSTTRSTRTDEPRSAWIHCGSSLFLLSQ